MWGRCCYFEEIGSEGGIVLLDEVLVGKWPKNSYVNMTAQEFFLFHVRGAQHMNTACKEAWLTAND